MLYVWLPPLTLYLLLHSIAVESSLSHRITHNNYQTDQLTSTSTSSVYLPNHAHPPLSSVLQVFSGFCKLLLVLLVLLSTSLVSSLSTSTSSSTSTMAHRGKFHIRLPSLSPTLPTQPVVPRLVLISGSTGAGKSSLGMTIALNTGILRCISTDVVRQVLRSVDHQKTPALYRSSYSGAGDAIEQWKECCDAVGNSVTNLVDDSLRRGNSLVLEGVHIIPSNTMIDRWKAAGGVATGVVLVIPDEKAHRDFIVKRGQMTGKGADGQLAGFQRIRQIQYEMMRLAEIHKWMIIEQKTIEPIDPVDVIDDVLNRQTDDLLMNGGRI